MSHNLKIKLLNAQEGTTYPKWSLDGWLGGRIFDLMTNGHPSPYAKIESDKPLYTVRLYLPLQRINDAQAGIQQDSLYLSNSFLSCGLPIEDGLAVKVELINYDELPKALQVSIELPEEKVTSWTQHEADFCANVFRSQVLLVNQNQPHWARPNTATPVLGKVTKVRSEGAGAAEGPCRVDESTIIHFDGLPTDQQKTIDFSKIGGLDEVITRLREIIQIPLQHPELLGRFDIAPPKGLLLYGPPGNGKTMLARAVSRSLGARFFSVEGPEGLSKYVGESEAFLRGVFEQASQTGNSVIFIDEIDSIAQMRDKASAGYEVALVSTLLNLMDGLNPRSRVFVIGATNRLNSVDLALRRPGRFDLEFEIRVPDFQARRDIIKKYVDLDNHALFGSDFPPDFINILADLTNGFSGADIASLHREATMSAIRRSIVFDAENGKIRSVGEVEKIKINRLDFEEAIKQITPTSRRGDSHFGLHHIENWKSLKGRRKVKRYFDDIHAQLNSGDSASTDPNSIRFRNIILFGPLGNGKMKLVRSFCKSFRYELKTLWVPDLLALGLPDAFSAIEDIFASARQLAPAFVCFERYELLKGDLAELISAKIHREVEQISGRSRIISGIIWNEEMPPPRFVQGNVFTEPVKCPPKK